MLFELRCRIIIRTEINSELDVADIEHFDMQR